MSIFFAAVVCVVVFFAVPRLRTVVILALTIIAAVLIATMPLPAHAQESPDALLRQAYELRRTGHDEDALPLLRQAHDADASPRVTAQLGLCEQATGDFDHAAEHLREALSNPNDPWVARHLDGLTQAYTIAQTRVTPVVPVTAPVPPAIVHEPAHRLFLAPVRIRPIARPDLTPLYVTIISGSTVFAGGISSWIARDVVVANYNDAVMRGQACDRAAAVSARDAATGLAVAGISAGAIAATVGTILLLTQSHGRSPVACAGPSCSVRF